MISHQIPEDGTADADSKTASPSARAKHFERQRSQRQSQRSNKSENNSTKHVTVVDGSAGKSELEKSTEKLDETPVLKPIRASLKKVEDEQAKAKGAAADQAAKVQPAASTVTASSSSTKPEAPTNSTTVKPAGNTQTDVKKEIISEPDTKGATKEKSPPKQGAGEKSVDPKPEAGKSPVKPLPSDTEKPSTSKAAAKSASPKKSDHTVVNVEERKSLTTDVEIPRLASDTGKSSVTGQTRTGWL